MSSEVGWTLVAAIAMVVGLCGVVIPVVPGLALIWLVALIHGFAVGWSAVGVTAMVVITALLAVSVVKSVVVPRRTAAASGASLWAQLGGVVGAIAGFFLIPVVGVLVGALAGVLVVELLAKRDGAEAWAATVGLAKGFGLSVVIDLGLGLVMLSVWSAFALTVVL